MTLLHQLRHAAIRQQKRAKTGTGRFHRFSAAPHRREAIEPAWNALRRVVDEVYPVELEDVALAKRIALTSRLGARDALHVAVMQRHDVAEIMSFDAAFDAVPGIRRRS